MKNVAIVSLLSLVLVGCQAGPKSAGRAAAPQQIAALVDQTTVYTCPSCGMDFDGAGQCTMCKVELVQTHVDYICPADDKPVERAGKCPRCAVNARVVKTAMAQKATGAPTGN